VDILCAELKEARVLEAATFFTQRQRGCIAGTGEPSHGEPAGQATAFFSER
jgi:hypothetical protein